MNRVLVTGGAGFVGSHVVRHFLTNTDWHLVLPVTFRHRGNGGRLRVAVSDHPEWMDRMTVIHHDLRGPFSLTQVHEMGAVDAIVNLASESHVDRSIEVPVPFVENNVALMLTMLELARTIQPDVFLQISTDEVYGPAPVGTAHAEWSPILPSNPYSASKAAQEAVAVSYWRTYGVPLVLTNTMNIVGETQDPEKFVPKVIATAARGGSLQVHVAPDGTPGSRFYLHARNQADALLFLLQRPLAVLQRYPADDRPARYHIVGEKELDNLRLAAMLTRYVDDFTGEKKEVHFEPVSFHSSRPGHDLRYALDGTKIAELGWAPPIPLESSLERTVRWTLDHPEWLL